MEINELQQNSEENLESKEVPANEEEMSMEDLLKAGAEVTDKLYSKDIVKVKVVQIAEENVFVDIGEKKEAVIPVADFKDEKMPEIGAEVMAVLERKGGEGKHTILSHRRAKEKLAWQWAKKMFEAKERVKGRVAEVVKGGYIVDLSGLRAFMPLSLSEIGGAHKHYLPLNAKVKFYITDFSDKDRKIVVSRRQVLEEDEKVRRTEVMGEVVSGRVVRAVVSKVIADGMFVRFQGIEGYVRLSDVAWKNPEEALKTFKRGQRIKCKILSVDKNNEKITFGVKQLTPNPVDLLKKKFPYKSVLKVKVVSVNKEGAKVRVSDHVDGYLSAAEYGFGAEVKEAQELNTVVIGINSVTYELVLSVKKFEEMEDRKKVQQYLKGTPTLTLGQILLENSEDEGEV